MSATRDPADDFVLQLIELVARCAGGFEEQFARQLEDQIRQDFGGERVYIHRAGWFDRAERDQCIRADRAAKRSLSWIAARYSLGKTTVVEILRAGEEKADPPA